MLRIRAMVAGIVLAALATTPAFAGQSVPVPETLTVSPTSTLTGIPASIAYGSALAGADAVSPSFATVTASTNNVTGFSVSWSATDLTGSGTIPSTARSIQLASVGAGCATVGALSGYTTSPGKLYTGPANTAQSFVVSTVAGSCNITTLRLHVAVPALAVSGNYTGTSTFAISENP